MEKAFDGIISRLDMTEGKNLWLEVSQQKPPKLKSKENKDLKKRNRISENCGTTTKGVTYM